MPELTVSEINKLLSEELKDWTFKEDRTYPIKWGTHCPLTDTNIKAFTSEKSVEKECTYEVINESNDLNAPIKLLGRFYLIYKPSSTVR